MFHCPCRFHHLRQEHLAVAEELADDVHAVHEWPFDDIHGARKLLYGFFQVFFQVVADAFAQGVDKAVV